MSKETRSKIPEGVTRVINAATGEVKWDKMQALEAENADLKAELLLTKNALANATAKLHGTRQHVYEVNQDG